jgi:hypothetical protein
MRYRVDPPNRPPTFFADPYAAVVFAAKQLTLHPDLQQIAVDALIDGKSYSWAYGFATCEISPCANAPAVSA